jgi:hypothetical protein
MRFEQDEAPTLAKLPDQHFELKHRRRLKVQKNNHVYLAQDKTYYSVPYSCIGSQVEVIYTATLVKIFHLGQCVATHRHTRTAQSKSTCRRRISPCSVAIPSSICNGQRPQRVPSSVFWSIGYCTPDSTLNKPTGVVMVSEHSTANTACTLLSRPATKPLS